MTENTETPTTENDEQEQEQDNGDSYDYEDFAVTMKINEFRVFLDDDSFKNLRRTVHDHPEWDNWFKTAYKNVTLNNPTSPEEAAEEFSELYDGFLYRFYPFFAEYEEDGEEAFEDFHERMMEQDVEMMKTTFEKQKRILDGEDPEEVFDSPGAIVSAKMALEDNDLD